MEKKYGDFIGENAKKLFQKSLDDGCFGTSAARYGYVYSEDRKELLIDEEAAETVRYIFQLYVEGLTFAGIGRRLDGLGIDRPTKHRAKLSGRDVDISNEGKWSPSVIKEILKWPVYTGEGICKIDGREFKKTAPVIVSCEIYNEAQKRLATCRSGMRGLARKDLCLLTKRIRDKSTGNLLVCRSSSNKIGKRVYMRKTYAGPSVKDGKRNYIPQDEVLNAVREFLYHEKALASYVLKKLGDKEKEVFELASLADYREQAQVVFEELQNLCTERMERHLAYEAGKMDEETYLEGEQAYLAACQKCEGRFQAIMEKAEVIKRGFSKSNKWLKLFLDINIPEELDKQHISKWIEMVDIEDFEKIEITPRMHEWKQMLPEEWLNAELEEG